MARRSYRPEQIIKKLREVEILLSQGSTVLDFRQKGLCRALQLNGSARLCFQAVFGGRWGNAPAA